MHYEILPINEERCSMEIRITILSEGEVVPEEDLDIIWADGDTSGLVRVVPIGCETTNVFCVNISLIETGEICCSSGQDCCTFDECFYIEGLRGCCGERIIVNEYNRDENGTGQFLELLVIGNGVCGDSTDLRGMHIDDNNGELIPANDFVNFFNNDQIGINNGFISFQNIPNWEAVPNGSLILVYPEGQHSNLPADDPTDTNQDGVYVLSASDSEYFVGNLGTWNDELQVLNYDGLISYPAWGLIEISPGADGMQVNFPDGSYSHGVSLGTSFFAAQNQFPLWITENSSSLNNCRFVGTDYMVKQDFTCDHSSNSQTPGLANSIDNQTLIDDLRGCLGLKAANNWGIINSDKKSSVSETKEEIQVYPNPFSDELILTFNTEQSGIAQINLFSLTGQELLKESWNCEEGVHTHHIKTEQHLPPGIVLLQFIFPSGEKQNQFLVRMDAR